MNKKGRGKRKEEREIQKSVPCFLFPVSLKHLLESKSCFKLICGAGNENSDEVEKLVALYSAAGCRFFDFAAREDVLKAAQRGLDFSIPKNEQKDYHFCVSVGTKNDAHFNKAKINPDKCKRCEQCIIACPQKAISQHFKVVEKNCIGCLKCKSVCKHGAIEVYNQNKPFEHSTFRPFNLSCVELHVSDENSAISQWDELCSQDYEMLSICIGRKAFSDEKIAELLKKMVTKRPPCTVIIQADGNPMTGGEDDFETTLPAVETGMFIKSLNLPVYLILSGGTNSKTAQLCKEKRLEVDGIAFGSYARKMVRKYIEREDFFENKTLFDEACSVAQKLLNSLK